MRIRRAALDDVAFLVELFRHEEVEPFLAPVRPKDEEGVRAEVERSQREPAELGVFVIEADGRQAGAMRFEVANRRSRIATLGALAIHPGFRGRRLADEAARAFQRHLLLDLGFHRLQLEVYGFNERAIRHAERAGFACEGRRRRAYWRHGAWWDGVLFGLVREDLGLEPAVDLLYEVVARHNLGVRSGDWEPLAECFAPGAELAFEGVPVGPFSGREAILTAYRERPPDDEVRVLAAEPTPDGVHARYAWASAPERAAGRMLVALREGLVERLVVTFEDALDSPVGGDSTLGSS